jgi:hypothetical protein
MPAYSLISIFLSVKALGLTKKKAIGDKNSKM